MSDERSGVHNHDVEYAVVVLGLQYDEHHATPKVA